MARSRTTCSNGIAKCLLRVSVSCLALTASPNLLTTDAPRPTMASSSRTPPPPPTGNKIDKVNGAAWKVG
eukprot:7684270-Prorocentrum_lima.AAC.1